MDPRSRPAPDRLAFARLLLTALVLLAGPRLAAAGVVAPLLQDGADPPEQVERTGPRRPISARDAGRPVLEIEVEGNRRWSASQLRAGLGQRVGQPLDPERIDRGLALLFETFHVRSSVWKQDTPEGMRLLLVVEELPSDLEPRFIGNDKIDTEELLEWAGLGERREVFIPEVPRIRQRLIERYRDKGYYFVEVHDRVRGGEVADEFGDVIFEIREGPRVHVREVVIHGNESLPDRGALFWKRGLRHLSKLELRGPSLFNWSGKPYVEDVLLADLVAMREVYRAHGFLDAVVELDRLEFSDDRARVRVHVVIDEGEPYIVSSVDLRAVERVPDAEEPTGYREVPSELVFPEDELRELLVLQPGMALEQLRIAADSRALQLYYGERGYLSHSSLGELDSWSLGEPELIYDVENKEVAVTYVIAQGIQRWIREVRVSGAVHTQDRVIRRQVSMLPGRRADMREIQASLRRITSSGYFTDERRPLDHREPFYRFLPTEDPEWVDLEFVVEEGQVVDFNIGGGFSSNTGLFGLLSLGVRNFDITNVPDSFLGAFGQFYRKEAFHGAGQRLDLQFSPGTERSETRIFFYEPDIFRRHFDRWSLDLELLIRERAFRDYDEDRERYRVRFGRQFLQDWTVFVGYAWQDVEVSDLDHEKPEPLPPALLAQEGSSRFSALLLELRYRNLDRFLDPRDGQVFSWSNEVSGGLLGEDNDFVKSELAYDRYVPVGPPTQDIRGRFLLSVGGGVADGYGDSEFTPYSERFFLGGLSTLRGFAFRGVGPNAGDVPLGGQTMLRGTVEYRHPLYSIPRPGGFDRVEMLRGHVFVDAGILDPDSFRIDPDELRLSAGFGVGLSFPIPLVFNFGFPIESGDGDRRQTFSFNIAIR